MSLDFDLSGIKNRAEVFPPDEQGKMNDTLHVLIWNMMAIDVTEITEKNVDEVWYRTAMWQTLIGPQFQQYDQARADLLSGMDKRLEALRNNPQEEFWLEVHTFVTLLPAWNPMPLTRADIENAIGLHTNVSTTTRNQFIKKVTGRFDPNR